jgi:hypothetical protein
MIKIYVKFVGKFLARLGLKEYPTLEKILELATPSTNTQIHNKALKYFIDHFEERYSRDYNPTEVNVAFLPCSDPNIYAKPSECFINPECKIMKFQVIRQDLRFQVEKLGVHQNPDRERLLNSLTQDPPQDENNAKIIFEYLASQQTCFTYSDCKMLADFKFIPVRNGDQHLNSPNNCFLKLQDEMYVMYISIFHLF